LKPAQADHRFERLTPVVFVVDDEDDRRGLRRRQFQFTFNCMSRCHYKLHS
jgi:hypothetical protein